MHMMYEVTLIPGDGIGPEIADATKRCIAATGVLIDWIEFDAGQKSVSRCGVPLSHEVI